MTSWRGAGQTFGKLTLRALTRPMLHVVHLALERLGYARTRRLLEATSPSPDPHRRCHQRALQVGVTVNLSARRGSWDKSCLRRSLVAWWVLRWLRVPTELTVGISLTGDRPLAHAWLEHHGQPVNDALNIAVLYPFTHSGNLTAEQTAMR
jgi:hypothetical protein